MRLGGTYQKRGPLDSPRAHLQTISVRLYPEMQAELDSWIEAQPDPNPSRPEAIRRLIGVAPQKKQAR